MTTLSVNQPRTYEYGEINQFPVIASDIIFEGSAVGENGSGYARPLVAGDPFLGFAVEKVDNSAGGAGAKKVTVRKSGDVLLPISGAAITLNDQQSVYASDDNTFTLTAGSNTKIGNVSRWVSTGWAMVHFDCPRPPTASIGTADIEGDAIDGTKIADDAIDSEHYAAASIDNEHLAADCVDAAKIADNGVSLEHLDSGVKPSHIIKFAGTETTTGGGAAEAHTVTGLVAATDKVSVTLIDNGTNNVTILQVAVTDDTLTVTFSGDPGNDAIYNYIVVRAAS